MAIFVLKIIRQIQNEIKIGEFISPSGDKTDVTADVSRTSLLLFDDVTGRTFLLPTRQIPLFFRDQLPVKEISDTAEEQMPHSTKLLVDTDAETKAKGGTNEQGTVSKQDRFPQSFALKEKK